MLVSRAGHAIDFSVDQEKVKEILEHKKRLGDKFPKYGILVLSYNASDFIEKTIDRIPKELYDAIEEIFIFDDNSPDNTFKVVEALKEESFWKEKLKIFKNPTNLRYGGNQKAGYRYANERGIDFTIMLHGDGQYAPEYIPDLILPSLNQGKEVVYASRMINKKDALKGGMPFYKFIGNQVLTRFENFILGTKLYEFHSGYRMYSTEVLNKIPYEENTNEFHFDTHIIIQCRALGVEIYEVPIKTFYGDEECNVDGFRYAWDVVKAVIGYRLHQLHITRKTNYFVRRDFVYTRKRSKFASHEKTLKLVSNSSKVLDVGSDSTLLHECLVKKDCEVVQLKNEDIDNIKESKIGREFDYILLSDVLPKIKDHEGFLRHIQTFLKEDGKIILTVPNIAIWFYRLSLLMGRFNYGDKGILDRKHLHFYTKESIRHIVEASGLNITKRDVTGIPFEVIFESKGQSKLIGIFDTCYYTLVKLWEKMFAYQFIVEAKITTLSHSSGEGRLK
jgi:glycosyltransferase involved in cell wall biosynthesis